MHQGILVYNEKDISYRRKFMEFHDWIGYLYYELQDKSETGKPGVVKSITFQVTDDCSLACTYCYQINKGKRRMSWDVAKRMVDLILSGEKGFKEYIGNTYGVVIDFIGGEPFLEINGGGTQYYLATGRSARSWQDTNGRGSWQSTSTAVDTLYAKWTKNIYTAEFDPNGGIIPGMPTQKGRRLTKYKINYDVQSDKIDVNDPTRKGYTFDKWDSNITNEYK